MSHALTIDTVRPGGMGPLLELAEREARQPPAGRALLGGWTSESGRLNQLHRLWRTGDGDPGCGVLARPPGLQHRQERLLAQQRPTLEANPGPWVYELRHYQLERGRQGEFLDLLLSHFELRETWSRAVGLWVPANGNLDEVVHLWYYRDLAHRAQVRAAAAAHPVWDRYRQKVLPMLAGQSSVLLTPVAFSPLR